MDQRSFKKPLRYKGHDYHAPCSVHVTICTYHRQRLFGSITNTGVLLNDAGRFVESALLTLDSVQNGVAIDTHLVMPDHLHAIVLLGTSPEVETTHSIPDCIRIFKMRVMKSWPKGVVSRGWDRYETHLWQQSYYDTLIRNDAHLETTRAYVLENPGRWLERE